MVLSRYTLMPLALTMVTMLAAPAQATTQRVSVNTLNASTTLAVPFLAGDVLRLNTCSSQVGALLQALNFSVGAGVDSLSGQASREIDTAAGIGPRLIGVNIDPPPSSHPAVPGSGTAIAA